MYEMWVEALFQKGGKTERFGIHVERKTKELCAVAVIDFVNEKKKDGWDLTEFDVKAEAHVVVL